MPETLIIRSAVEADAAALLAIYRPFVESTAVSFETVVPTVEALDTRMGRRIGSVRPTVGLSRSLSTCIRTTIAEAWVARSICGSSKNWLKKVSATPTQALLSQTRAASHSTGGLASSSSVSSRPLAASSERGTMLRGFSGSFATHHRRGSVYGTASQHFHRGSVQDGGPDDDSAPRVGLDHF